MMVGRITTVCWIILSAAASVCGAEPEPAPTGSGGGEIKALSTPTNVANTSKKGSLLVFPKIELRWAQEGPGEWVLTQDTVLQLTNDGEEEVFVRMQFVNGDPAIETAFEGSCVDGVCD